jgi:dipeptidase E
VGQVVAMGGGGWMMGDLALDRFVLGLTDARRPRICFVPTASGDHPSSERFLEAFPPAGFDASILRLFDREVADLGAFLGEQDVVYVGGGNTVSMLAVWRAHGVDRALRDAHDAGVVMTGMSAGANCWFEACTTDSFQLGRAELLRDGLGFVPGSFTPHYDSEPARRPAVLELIASGALPPGFACDDDAAVHLADGTLREAVRSRPDARVFRVEPDDGRTREDPLPARDLS